MTKKLSLSRLHQPIHPAIAVVLIGLVVIAGISALVLRSGQNQIPHQYQTQSTPTAAPQLNQPQLVPTALPVSVGIASWGTYTNRTDGISIKLPQQYTPQWPGRLPTPIQYNPDGSAAQWNFEDFYPDDFRTTKNYSFAVRINKRGHVNFNNSCKTDEECFDVLYNFYKPLPNTKLFLLHTKILNRDVQGLAIAKINSTPGLVPSDAGSISDIYFEFTHNGKPYELNILGVASYQQLLIKQPYIDAVASTISFSQ